MASRYDAEASIEYTEEQALKAALVGRSIVSQSVEGFGYSKVITFTLDDGTLLRAHATDGGCACSNGCFSVDSSVEHTGTILNVEVSEEVHDGHWDKETDLWVDAAKTVIPGSISDGSSTIRVFVYTNLSDKIELVESEGEDNGYYGWGFWFEVVEGESNAN